MLDHERAWELSMSLQLVWNDEDEAVLAPLVDAMIMRVGPEAFETLARPVAESMWRDLQPAISRALADEAKRDDLFAGALDDALADLELGPTRSRLAVSVLAQAAMDLADHTFFLEDCLDCIEDGMTHAPPERRPELVARATAALALRAVPEYGLERPDDGERARARARVRALAALGREGLPRLAPAIEALAAEPLPPLRNDGVLQAVMRRRLASTARRKLTC